MVRVYIAYFVGLEVFCMCSLSIERDSFDSEYCRQNEHHILAPHPLLIDLHIDNGAVALLQFHQIRLLELLLHLHQHVLHATNLRTKRNG